MPIVVKYDDPALVATLAANAGQFATDEAQRERARAEVGQVMGMNADLRQQEMQQYGLAQRNALAASTLLPQQQAPGGPGMTPGGATINYPQGTMPPPGEQYAYGQNLAQKAQAGVFDQKRQQHIAQQQPVLNQIQQAARAGQIDPQTAESLVAQIEAGGDGYQLIEQLQQKGQQQRGMESAKAALKTLTEAGRVTPEEAVRMQAMIDAGENPFLKGGRATGAAAAGAEDKAFATQQKEQRAQQEKLHKFRMESIDADIKALEDELKGLGLGEGADAQEKGIRDQIKALREQQRKARGEYEGFLTTASQGTSGAPQQQGGGGAASGAAQSARLPVAVVPSQIQKLAPGTKFIGPDGREWVRR